MSELAPYTLPEEGDVRPLDADIVCVGFGPATGGFLTTLVQGIQNAEAPIESRAFAGLPPQIVCYERADDIGFGVSGAVTLGRSIRRSLPDLTAGAIPMAADVVDEKMVYLLDPHGASRRPWWMRGADAILRRIAAPHNAYELPWTPSFLNKHNGLVLSLGQFNQWVGQQLMMSGLAQIWPSTPVAGPLVEAGTVAGIQLAQDHTAIRADLTVVADGPVGAVGQRLDELFGMPVNHAHDEWALGMKMVIELGDGPAPPPGTVLHTIGYPEPEIFGFVYFHPDRVASAGIFIPSWMRSPVRTAYRYLQHYIQHPYLWRWFQGGTMRSWGAKSLLESGQRGEPWLAGDGYARIGEGSGTTNVLTGSGVDEAWESGVQLAQAVLSIWKDGLAFSREHLQARYAEARRDSWLGREAEVAAHARDGFQSGLFAGFAGMALAGLSNGKLHWPSRPEPAETSTIETAYRYRLGIDRVEEIQNRCRAEGISLHDAFMDACGWPPVQFDGRVLVSHQDALLMGGKVQAPSAASDHVQIRQPHLCQSCHERLCIEMCSGQALHPGPEALPAFDREKCVHCGACLWNCTKQVAPGVSNLVFAAGPGGLHSAEN